MAMRRLRGIAALTLAAMIVAPFLLFPRRARACGPFFRRAVMVFSVHPEFPLDRFARGEIGVLQRSYARSYLVVAYRYLSGAGLSKEEQKAAVELWQDRMYLSQPQSNLDSEISQWTEQRNKVPGLDSGPKLDASATEIQVSDKSYNYFRNCNADSFETAANVLAARIKQFGVDSAEVKDWVKAQDVVYGNCIGAKAVPALGMSGLPPIIHADRAYQIAAASFYARDFDAAERMFREIGSDPKSPWRTIAPYMVARTLIRKATLNAPEGKVDTTELAKAENQLQNVLSDPKLSSIHPAAERLVGYVGFRLHPDQRLHELAHSVAKNEPPARFKQDLCDYTLLLDRYEPKDSAPVSAEAGRDDLTDWVFTFQAGGHAALAHSLENWRQSHSTAWLLAAISNAGPKDPELSELLTAAADIKEGAPGYAMAVYHRARLMIASGQHAAARRLLDAVFALGTPALTRSSINLLTAERLNLARNLDEFLGYAVREPAGITLDEDDMEIPEDAYDASKKADAGKTLVLGDDAAEVLNQRLPLDLLAEAARSKSLPTSIRNDIALAGWVRAVLVGDEKTGKELALDLQQSIPELKSGLGDYISAATPEGKKFAGVFLILKNPGCRPYVTGGLPRETPLGEIDSYRDNWWCDFLPGVDLNLSNYAKMDAAAAGDKGAKAKRTGPASPSFLTLKQREAAFREWKAVSATPAAPNYLPVTVVDYAAKNPDDPRVPEALYLAVRSTRYGCTDKQTVQYSKAAFDLLHKRYPSTEWAKKTKYWYGN